MLHSLLHFCLLFNSPQDSRFSGPEEGTFEQILDHFQHSSTDTTWTQHFQCNASFHAPGGPVFLLLGGEGPASPVWVSAQTSIMMYAKMFNAAVFQLEHRFYGKSQPFQNLDLSNLALLSSQQALADANHFSRSLIFVSCGILERIYIVCR